MKMKKKRTKIKQNGTCSQEECPRRKLLRQCRNALLLTASYQIFSVCLEPAFIKEPTAGPDGGKTLISTAAQQISSLFVTPAQAVDGKCVKYHDIPSRGGGGGCRGCVGCVGCIGYTGPSEYEIGQSLNDQGAAAVRNGDWETAANFFRQALTHSPNDTVIQVNLKHAEAMMAYKRGDWQKAANYWRDALAISTDTATQAKLRNNLQEVMENLQREQERREKEARKAAVWAPVQRLQEAQRYNEEGNKYFKNKQWQQAVDTYKKGLEKSPNDDVLRQNYEYALRQLAVEQRKEIQKQQQAVNALKAALRKHPNNAEIRKNYESAKADLEAKQAKLTGQAPPSGSTSAPSGLSAKSLQEANTLKDRGNQYANNKQWRQAADAYKTALDKNPGNAGIRQKYANALSRLAAEQRQAIEGQGSAAATLPPQKSMTEAHNLNEQAGQLYKNKQYQQAVDACRAALEKWPGNDEIRHNYVLALSRLASEMRGGSGTPAKGPSSTSAGKQLGAALGQPREAFDTGKASGESSLTPLKIDGRNPFREQAIHKGKRTEAIIKLETQRNEAKNTRLEMEQKVAEIEKKPNKTEAETKFLAESQKVLPEIKKKEEFLNFQINEELKKPAKSKKSNKEQDDDD